MILMDNLRFDQWKIIEPIITELYKVDEEDFFLFHPANCNTIQQECNFFRTITD